MTLDSDAGSGTTCTEGRVTSYSVYVCTCGASEKLLCYKRPGVMLYKLIKRVEIQKGEAALDSTGSCSEVLVFEHVCLWMVLSRKGRQVSKDSSNFWQFRMPMESVFYSQDGKGFPPFHAWFPHLQSLWSRDETRIPELWNVHEDARTVAYWTKTSIVWAVS